MAFNTKARSRGVQDDKAGLWTRLIFRRVKRRYGHIPLTARICAHDPKLLELYGRMSRYTAAPGVVSLRLEELAQLKVAVMVGCPF